jgi:hypothetical protein
MNVYKTLKNLWVSESIRKRYYKIKELKIYGKNDIIIFLIDYKIFIVSKCKWFLIIIFN